MNEDDKMTTKNFSKLEKKLKIKFKNQDLLKQALIHRSYLNENPNFPLGHNERLEFLGDAVIELIVTEYLYQHYPNPEGELTNWRASLVNSQKLFEVARELGLDAYLYLSKGEAKDNNLKARQTILANVFEAVVGALYLDRGFEPAKTFIHDNLIVHLSHIIENHLYHDAKSSFQEAAQDKAGITPSYKVLEESGPDHAKHFKIGVYLGDELVATGTGSSKQEAQMAAAKAGLEAKDW